MWVYRWLTRGITHWLTKPLRKKGVPVCDFEALRHEVRLGDVLLVEGNTRVSGVIRHLTTSPWSHSALYIGRIYDIESQSLRRIIKSNLDAPDTTQLIIEGVLGKGILVSKLSKYEGEHIRICRPKGLSHHDAQLVLSYAISSLGKKYDVPHIFDLARLLLPWTLFPRKWGSSLFKSSKDTKREICSSLIAEAFERVNFPILPNVKHKGKYEVVFSHRNSKLYVPADFDYSPFFEIVKYPMVNISHAPAYRSLPWEETADRDVR